MADEMTSLQQLVDHMRTGDETGAGAGVATLEAQMTSLQQLEDEIRAGNGTLEELKPG